MNRFNEQLVKFTFDKSKTRQDPFLYQIHVLVPEYTWVV